MAGQFRIKVFIDSADPFWMLVRTEESPQISHIAKKIEQQYANGNVENLLLDGCILPLAETSELLRDGDVVHVGIKELRNTEFKNHRKRKLSKEEPDNHSCSNAKPELNAELQEPSDAVSKKKKSKKHEKRRATNSEEVPLEAIDKVNSEKNEDTVSKENQILEEVKQKVCADSNDLCKTKKRKRKRNKKTSQSDMLYSNNGNDKLSVVTNCFVNKAPAELKLPKWQQSKNKKIVFSSSDDEPEYKQNDHEKNKTNENGGDLTSVERLTSGISSSIIDPSPSSFSYTVSPNKNGGDRDFKGVNGTSSNFSVKGNSVEVYDGFNTNRQVAVNVAEEYRSIETNKEDEDHNADGWHRQHQNQYDFKLQEEKQRKHKCASALDKTATPVHIHSGGEHQVIQQNPAEYLKMSPEDRGAKLPPYMKTKRLPNGAIVYSRIPVLGNTEKSPFNSYNGTVTEDVVNDVDTTHLARQEKETGNSEQNVNIEPSDLYRDYSSFPDLTADPKVGDRIAYKVLEMGENYCPEISDYREAEVLCYDNTRQFVTLQLLKACKKKTSGKFDLPGEGSHEEDNVTCMPVDLSSLFELKLIASANEGLRG